MINAKWARAESSSLPRQPQARGSTPFAVKNVKMRRNAMQRETLAKIPLNHHLERSRDAANPSRRAARANVVGLPRTRAPRALRES